MIIFIQDLFVVDEGENWTVKGYVLIIIADFEPHTLDCNLCKSNVENKDLQIKTLDKIMMSHGYNNNCS